MVVKRFCDACGGEIPDESVYHALYMHESDGSYTALEICEACGEKVRTALGLKKDGLDKGGRQ